MPKKVQIDFALKTPEDLAEWLGVSRARVKRIMTIVSDGGSQKKNGRSGRIAVHKRNARANARSTRRSNANTAR
jgi:hypothetical protein